MLKALLVDFDGTLADTALANALAYQAALKHYGITRDVNFLQKTICGNSWHHFLPPLCSDITIQNKIVLHKRSIYYDYLKNAPINTMLVSLLKRMHDFFPIVLVTNASRDPLYKFLLSKKLLSLFADIVTGEDVNASKPSPEAYILAATRLGVIASECLVLEDSDVGILAAQKFGAQVWKVIF